VRVEVFDCVGDCEGSTARLLANPVYNNPNIRNLRKMFIRPYNMY